MTSQLSLNELHDYVLKLVQAIPAVTPYLPTFGYTVDGARPHIEVHADGYHYVVVERGNEVQRRITKDADELCYWILEASTSSVASDLSVAARADDEDPRRELFEIHIELIGKLSIAWADQLRNRYQELLKHAPFDDNSSLRIKRTVELQTQGVPNAWNIAVKEYPFNTAPTVPGSFRRVSMANPT